MTAWTRVGIVGLLAAGASLATPAARAQTEAPAGAVPQTVEISRSVLSPARIALDGDARNDLFILNHSKLFDSPERLSRSTGPLSVEWNEAIALITDPDDQTLGASLQPVGAALRAQLGLPEKQGLVVASLIGDGAAAQAGLHEKDILLSLDGHDLGQPDDLQRQLKAVGDKEVLLGVLRAGKRVELNVRPVTRVTLGPAGREKVDYFLGVPVTPVDDTLRIHLRLPVHSGLVVTEVVAGSPAEKAGVKPHDVLLELGGKALTSTEVLIEQIQAAKDKPTPVALLRAGRRMMIDVTPEKRTVKLSLSRGSVRILNLRHVDGKAASPTSAYQSLFTANTKAHDTADPIAKRIDRLDTELKALRKAVEDLRDALKTAKPTGR